MASRKQIFTILGSLIGGITIIILAMTGMVYHISHRLDCERFNIDNIELRTETDIPNLAEDPVCIYDPKLKVKSNFFRIDTQTVNMHNYIGRNHFNKINNDSFPVFIYQKNWNAVLRNKPGTNTLYARRGLGIGEESGNMDSWLYILDSSSGELWMEIIRSKHH